jgi:hypothetical protein
MAGYSDHFAAQGGKLPGHCERHFFHHGLPGQGDFVKKFLAIFVLIAVYFFGAGSLAPAQDESEPLPCDYKKTGLDASKFYLYLTQDTPYQLWPAWPGKTRLAPGTEPHGAFITTYVNPAALQAIVSRSGMAFGSLLVTENYNSDKKLTGLMVMLKIKGYNPQGGDWYWFHYDARGSVLAEGRLESCIKCHRTKNESDYVVE